MLLYDEAPPVALVPAAGYSALCGFTFQLQACLVGEPG